VHTYIGILPVNYECRISWSKYTYTYMKALIYYLFMYMNFFFHSFNKKVFVTFTYIKTLLSRFFLELVPGLLHKVANWVLCVGYSYIKVKVVFGWRNWQMDRKPQNVFLQLFRTKWFSSRSLCKTCRDPVIKLCQKYCLNISTVLWGFIIGTYILTYTHTYIHTYIHTYLHTYIHTYKIKKYKDSRHS
jgi:hypothetical protein